MPIRQFIGIILVRMARKGGCDIIEKNIKIRRKIDNVGRWDFLIGIILAVVAGFWVIPGLAIILVILGLIIGFLNITAVEIETYLVAVIALLVIGTAGLQALSGAGELSGAVQVIQTMLRNFISFVAASGLVVAIRAALSLGGADEE